MIAHDLRDLDIHLDESEFTSLVVSMILTTRELIPNFLPVQLFLRK